MTNIETRVKQIVADKLGVDYEDIRTSSSFTNDLGADSLDTVELIMELEKAFGINRCNGTIQTLIRRERPPTIVINPIHQSTILLIGDNSYWNCRECGQQIG